MHDSFLTAHNYRFLKIGLAVCVISSLATYGTTQFGTPYGGSPVGLTLGIISLLIMLWLMSYSIRKRMYGYAVASVRAWLSGHVYLGTALMVVATLHAGFSPTWNIHWLAWGMMMLTSLSGIAGVIVYVTVPQRIAANLGNQSFDDLVRSILAIDGELLVAVQGLPAEFRDGVVRTQGIPRQDNLLVRFFGDIMRCPVADERNRVAELAPDAPREQRRALRHLLALLTAKTERIRLLRRDQRYRTLLSVWLIIHIPATTMAAGLVFLHVLTTLYFW